MRRLSCGMQVDGGEALSKGLLGGAGDGQVVTWVDGTIVRGEQEAEAAKEERSRVAPLELAEATVRRLEEAPGKAGRRGATAVGNPGTEFT
jgi:hypothetical protein